MLNESDQAKTIETRRARICKTREWNVKNMCEWFRIGRIIIYYIHCIIYTYLQLQKNKSWTRVRLGSLEKKNVMCFWPFVSCYYPCCISEYHFDVGSIGPIPFQSLPARLYLQILTGVLVPNMLIFSYKIKNSCFPFLIWNSHKLLNYRWLRWYIPNEGGKNRWFRFSIEMMDYMIHSSSKDHLKLEYLPWLRTKAAVKFTSKVGLCLSIGSLFAGGTKKCYCWCQKCAGVCGTWVILFLARWVNHGVASVLWPISNMIYTSYHYYFCILHAGRKQLHFWIFLELKLPWEGCIINTRHSW